MKHTHKQIIETLRATHLSIRHFVKTDISMTETGRVLHPGFEKAPIYDKARPFRLDPDI